MKKIIPYCTPAMFDSLGKIKDGANVPPMMFDTLKARGWIDADGRITAKGIEYLNGR